MLAHAEHSQANDHIPQYYKCRDCEHHSWVP